MREGRRPGPAATGARWAGPPHRLRIGRLVDRGGPLLHRGRGWWTHGLPRAAPHPNPSSPAATVGHDSRRVVNRCACAQSVRSKMPNTPRPAAGGRRAPAGPRRGPDRSCTVSGSSRGSHSARNRCVEATDGSSVHERTLADDTRTAAACSTNPAWPARAPRCWCRASTPSSKWRLLTVEQAESRSRPGSPGRAPRC